jgi:hypothetical protein
LAAGDRLPSIKPPVTKALEIHRALAADRRIVESATRNEGNANGSSEDSWRRPNSQPTGKLVGIIDTRADFDKVVRAVQIIGPISIEALCGEEGVNLLERVNTFFFSDMEDRVLQRHIEELKAGHIVALIKVPDDQIDEIAKIATQNGARRLVYFGFMTVTWLTK